MDLRVIISSEQPGQIDYFVMNDNADVLRGLNTKNGTPYARAHWPVSQELQEAIPLLMAAIKKLPTNGSVEMGDNTNREEGKPFSVFFRSENWELGYIEMPNDRMSHRCYVQAESDCSDAAAELFAQTAAHQLEDRIVLGLMRQVFTFDKL